MGIIFDIVLVSIVLLSIYFGYKRGIVEVGYKLVTLILSLFVSIVLYTPITYYVVNNTYLDEQIEAIIIKNAIVNTEKEDNNSNNINEFLQKYTKDIVQGTQNSVVEASAKPIAINIIRIGVIIVLFILTRMILVILKMCTNIVSKIPILKQCNELVGLIYGILRGLVVVYGILAIMFFIVTMSETNAINEAIQTSYVTKFLYENNLILKLVEK